MGCLGLDLAIGATGLSLDRTLDVAIPALENASVQVRKTALEIAARSLAMHAKAQVARGVNAGGAESLEEAVLEIKEEYLGPPMKSAVMKQVCFVAGKHFFDDQK